MMHFSSMQGLLVLAQEGAPTEPPGMNRLQQVVEGWQNSNQVFPVAAFGYFVLAVMVVMGLAWLRQWHKRRPKDPSSSILFRKIARELNIHLLDQWLMFRIARHHHLPSPLTLLMSRQTMVTHAQTYVESLPPLRQTGAQARVTRIIAHLFGTQENWDKDMQGMIDRAKFNMANPGELAAAQQTLQFVTSGPAASSTQVPPAGAGEA